MKEEELIKIYLKGLNDNQKKTLEIAKSHLESSFCLEKSNGFLKFKEEYLKSILNQNNEN